MAAVFAEYSVGIRAVPRGVFVYLLISLLTTTGGEKTDQIAEKGNGDSKGMTASPGLSLLIDQWE